MNEEGRKPMRRSFGQFLKKYFLEGTVPRLNIVWSKSPVVLLLAVCSLLMFKPMITPSGQKLALPQTGKQQQNEQSSPAASFFTQHRKLLGVLIPFLLFQISYWTIACLYNLFHLYKTNYVMSLVMIFGGLVGGMTTEGGGAVAFPVMTLVLHIAPVVARDFSVMIQSCGLAAASATIFLMAIVIEWYSVIFTTTGAVFGVVFALEVIDPLMSASQKKMAFVAIFFSFALALFILNLEKKRVTFDRIQNFSFGKAVILVCNGFVGGIFTGIAGSGVDVYSFSILTLLFRISEKVATPTSVVLMAINSNVTFAWRYFVQSAILQDSWDYFAVCVPVVVLFAPVGSFLGSHFHRLTLAAMIYILETVALVGAFVVVRPPLGLTAATIGTIAASFVFYWNIGNYGKKLAEERTKKNVKVLNLLSSS